MKVLALVSCLCAVASAGYLGPHAYAAVGHLGYGAHYAGPQHIPVIGPNGVPLEPPANVAARAAHAAAHAAASHGSAGLYLGGVVGPYAGGHLGYAPVIGPHGVPLELPENVAARAAHAAAHVEAKARNGDLAVLGPLGGVYGAHGLGLGLGLHGVHAGHAATVIGPHGVPLEPPANVAARALHAAAHAEAAAHSGAGYLHYRRRRGIFAGAHHIPVIGPHGVPLELPENVAARAAHAAAHAAASHGAIAVGPVGPIGIYGVGHAYPTLAHDGQPLETPEVVAAKSAHFAAHAEANARNHADLGYAGVHYAAPYGAHLYGSPYAVGHVPAIGHNGVPLDTPEVAAAKAAHLQAHLAAKSSHGLYY